MTAVRTSLQAGRPQSVMLSSEEVAEGTHGAHPLLTPTYHCPDHHISGCPVLNANVSFHCGRVQPFSEAPGRLLKALGQQGEP